MYNNKFHGQFRNETARLVLRDRELGKFRLSATGTNPHFSRKTREMGHPSWKGSEALLVERFYGCGFVVFHVEDGVELGDLQQIVDFFGQVEEFEFAALILGGGESADQFADARAVDVIDLAQVQDDLLIALGKQVAHSVAQNDAAFAERDATAAVYDGHAVHLPTRNLHAHWEASLPPAVGPWTCLINLSSVPAWVGRISTTSINERIRNIPRPLVFSRFSGAKGLGILLRSIPAPWSRMVMIRSPPVCSKASVTFLSGA